MTNYRRFKQQCSNQAVAWSVAFLPFTMGTPPANSSKTDQSNNPRKTNKSIVKQNKESCCPEVFLSRLGIKYRAPKGLGYDQGYTTVETFITPSQSYNWRPFLDARGHVFNSGRLAANAGVGLRYGDKQGSFVTGINAYYDYRDSKHFNSQQLGGGLEFLSRYIDLRINGAYPFSNDKFISQACFSGFCGHFALAQQDISAALGHIDGEIGSTLYQPLDLYAAIGSYYLFERTINQEKFGDAVGGRARLSLKIFNGLTIGGDVTFDKIYNTRAQGWVSISLPLAPATMRKYSPAWNRTYADCDRAALQLARMTSPVYRDEIIPVQDLEHQFPIINPITCCPAKFIVVNNCNPHLGNGTFEDPFSELQRAAEFSAPGDILYLFAGDGTSRGYDKPIVLKDFQKLIGASTSLPVGCFCIPACACSRPVINCEEDPICITLANCNEIAGIELCGGQVGIGTKNGRPISGGFIHDSLIFEPAENAISINACACSCIDIERLEIMNVTPSYIGPSVTTEAILVNIGDNGCVRILDNRISNVIGGPAIAVIDNSTEGVTGSEIRIFNNKIEEIEGDLFAPIDSGAAILVSLKAGGNRTRIINNSILKTRLNEVANIPTVGIALVSEGDNQFIVEQNTIGDVIGSALLTTQKGSQSYVVRSNTFSSIRNFPDFAAIEQFDNLNLNAFYENNLLFQSNQPNISYSTLAANDNDLMTFARNVFLESNSALTNTLIGQRSRFIHNGNVFTEPTAFQNFSEGSCYNIRGNIEVAYLFEQPATVTNATDRQDLIDQNICNFINIQDNNFGSCPCNIP